LIEFGELPMSKIKSLPVLVLGTTIGLGMLAAPFLFCPITHLHFFPWQVEGGLAPTVTVTIAVADPPSPVQVTE
jgi:hypothetical protein